MTVALEEPTGLHREQHRELHQALVTLLDDYLRHHKGALLANVTTMQLFRWSHAQCIQPCEAKP